MSSARRWSHDLRRRTVNADMSPDQNVLEDKPGRLWAVPVGWQWSLLSEVTVAVDSVSPAAIFENDFQYIDVAAIDNQRHRIVDAAMVEAKKAPSRARQLVQKGDTVFSSVRVYLENIAQVPEALDGQIASTAFTVLRPAPEIEGRYLFHYMTWRQTVSALAKKQRGNSPPAVLEKDIRGLEIPVPPAKEQSRIASKIDELFSRIEAGEDALNRASALIERYRKSVLKAAVTGELTRDWRKKNAGKIEPADKLLERILKARRKAWEKSELAVLSAEGVTPRNDEWKKMYREPSSPNATGLPMLPNGWTWASFAQLGNFGRGKSKHRPRNDPKLFDGPYPFLQTGIVRQSNGRIREFDATYNEVGLAQSKIWPAGTICITIAANIAASGILEFAACFPDSVVGLTPDKEINGQFIEFFIRTARGELDRYAPATAQKNINLEILGNVAIPLPPHAEQVEIMSRASQLISNADNLEAELERQVRIAQKLRQSTLKSAFEGRLVPHDSKDEPASVLLARIREAASVISGASKEANRRKRWAEGRRAMP